MNEKDCGFLPASACASAPKMASAKTAETSATAKAASESTAATAAETARARHEDDMAIGAAAGVGGTA